jgi:hypothetical protein
MHSDGKIAYKLHRKQENEVGKLFLPMNEIFDAINDAHVSQFAHLKSNPTHKAAQKLCKQSIYVVQTILLATSCYIKQNPKLKNKKEQKKPCFLRISVIDSRCNASTLRQILQ